MSQASAAFSSSGTDPDADVAYAAEVPGVVPSGAGSDVDAAVASDAVDDALAEVAEADAGSGHDEAEANQPRPPQLKHKAIRGGAWTVLGFGSGQALRLASNIVLARVLSQGDFGLMGLVTVVLIGLQLFSDIGIGPSIIQNKRQDARFLNTAWTIQVFRGFVLWGAAAVLAWPLSRLWADGGGAALLTLLPVVAVSAAISGFQSTNWFTANRHLAVKWMMLIELAALTAQAIVMIVYAFAIDASYWALAAGVPAYALIRTVLSHFLPGVRNRFDWDRTAVHELVRFGKWLFVSTVITFLAMRSDTLLLQSFAGVATVGLFWIALQFADLGPSLAVKLGSMVGFPALSEVHRSRPQDFSKELLRVRRAVLLPIYTLLLAMILFAPAFFCVLYRVEYWGCGWIVQALAVNSLAGQINTSYGHAYMATGNTFRNMTTVFAQWLLVVGASSLGFYLAGETGFLLGLASAQFGKYPVDAYLASKTGVWQPRFDLPLLVVGVALALVMLAGSLWLMPWAIELNDVVHQGVTQLKDTLKGAQG